MNRATFVALAIAVVAGAGLFAVNAGGESNSTTLEASAPTKDSTRTTALSDAPPVLGTNPGLENLDGWLNTDNAEFTDFDGQVRIVQFWTFGCINCKRTLENLGEIYAQHGKSGNFEIIGVHAPEFNHEADVDNIIDAAARLEVVWPIALDTNKYNFRNWQEGRRFWPRTYVLDSQGQIRFDHIGEGNYEELAATVDWLLSNES
jgi:thiol-disulfide isomerase/thioredoxin